MGGSVVSFPVQRTTDGEMRQVGPAWLQFVGYQLRNLDESGWFYRQINWFLRMAEITENKEFVHFRFPGASGVAATLADASSHVLVAVAHHMGEQLHRLLAKHGCRLSGECEVDGASSMFMLCERFFELDGTVAQAHFSDRLHELGAPYQDYLGRHRWECDTDGRLFRCLPDEVEVCADDLRAPMEAILFANDDSAWVSELESHEREVIMRFYRSGICHCPICLAYTSAEVAAAQPLALTAMADSLEALGLGAEHFRLRWNPVDKVWAFVFVFPDGVGREFSTVGFSTDLHGIGSLMSSAIVHSWIQPCWNCPTILLEPAPVMGNLSCPSCATSWSVQELYETFLETLTDKLP